jgi:hypothetical protein
VLEKFLAYTTRKEQKKWISGLHRSSAPNDRYFSTAQCSWDEQGSVAFL